MTKSVLGVDLAELVGGALGRRPAGSRSAPPRIASSRLEDDGSSAES